MVSNPNLASVMPDACYDARPSEAGVAGVIPVQLRYWKIGLAGSFRVLFVIVPVFSEAIKSDSRSAACLFVGQLMKDGASALGQFLCTELRGEPGSELRPCRYEGEQE